MTTPIVMRTGTLYIHATNVHQGGGKSLLLSIIQALDGSRQTIFLLDSRMTLPEGAREGDSIKRVQPSIWQRLKAERWLACNVTEEDTVLCFGNLPPLFKLRARTQVFMQNRYLVDDVGLDGFPLRVKLRLLIERLWLTAKLTNANEFVVQTPTMKKLFEKNVAGKIPVRMLPFIAEPKGYSRCAEQLQFASNREYDFVYVATGEPHKNHHRLIEAWCLLAEEGLFPSLCVTLDVSRFTLLCSNLEKMKRKFGIKINNAGELTHQKVLALYSQAGAAIYPSIFESFGLPLLEARQAGLPVLAAEMDYVRDILDPEQTFNPDSATSIARAVKRFMRKEEPVLPLLDAKNFLEQLQDCRECLS